MMNGLDLFSGIGGLSIALAPWVRSIAYCEYDRFCHAVLLSAMQRGDIDVAPIWDDVRTLRKQHLDIPIDIIFGGFPCQDISAAGYARGLAGERSGLYWQIERLIKEINPDYVFLENVPAIRTRGLNAIVESLTEIGYDCRWTIVSAGEVGAPHRRERWFILAHANGERLEGLELQDKAWPTKPRHTNFSMGEIQEIADSSLLRENNELPRPMDEIRALGNAVVPAQAREAFMRLMGLTEPNTPADGVK